MTLDTTNRHEEDARMHRVSRAVALILTVVAALLASGAQTAHATELTNDQRIAIGIIADHAWPQSRCDGFVQVKFLHTVGAPVGDVMTANALAAGAELAGYAYGAINGSCDVGVRSDLAPADACTTAVHEAGHLADSSVDEATGTVTFGIGGPHHGDGDPVMGSADDVVHLVAGGETADGYVWPACQSLVTMTRDEAIAYSWDRWPAWSVRCARQTPSRFQCVRVRRYAKVAHAAGRVERRVFRVWATTVNAATDADYGYASIR